MKNLFYSLFVTVLCSFSAFAQTEGINFQGVARNAAGEVLVSQPISLRLSILMGSESGAVAYSETRLATTNPQGIFAVVVGDGTAASKTGDFSSIDWGNAAKFIKVEMDPNSGNNFLTMGISRMQAVSVAFYAYGVDASNVKGVLPVRSGGTGVASISELKTSMSLDQVNNTADANKPLSTASQAALATKANASEVTTSLATKVDKVTGKGLSTNDYTTAEKTKLAAISGTNTGDQDLSALATNTALALKANTADVTASLATKANASDVTASLATKVDKVTGKELSTNDYTTAEKTKLAAITGTNTGDQDLSALATNTALALKANSSDVTASLATKANASDVTASLATKVDKVTGKELSTNDYTTAEKTKLAAITGTNTGDQDLSALATNTALALKANTADVTASLATKANASDVTTSLATKVDKVTGKELSSNDYTTAEKTKLAAITGTNTGDQDLSAYATTAQVATKANASDVTASLATKVDKVTGKELSTNDYTTAEKDKLAAITGTNTGDQDLSALATNTALALKANASDVTASLATKVDKVTGKELSTNDYTTAEKTKLAAITGTNTGDQDLSAYSTAAQVATKANASDVTASLATKANASDVTASLATKVDKVTGKELSTNDYSTAEKTKLAAITGTNTGDQDLSALATNTALALKANTADVTASLATKANTADVTASLATKANASDLSNYVTTNTAQTITEEKTFSKDLTVNGITVGRGGGGSDYNTAFGLNALLNNTGAGNTAVGRETLIKNENSYNSAFGYRALKENINGSFNVAVGFAALINNTDGSINVAIGNNSLSQNTLGSNNTAIGNNTLTTNTIGSKNTAIGNYANVASADLTNATALGYGAKVSASNTIQLGADGTFGTVAVTDVKTTGTLTAGTVTYPNAHNGMDDQVLTINSAGTATWAAAVGGVPYTGATQAVDLGLYDLTVNGITVGRGGNNMADNTAIGSNALGINTTGLGNTANGYHALSVNTEGNDNTAIGFEALKSNSDGSKNTASGYKALTSNLDGFSNTAIGYMALSANQFGTNNTAIGEGADVGDPSLTNATAIGSGAIVTASDMIQLGNTAVKDVKTSGNLTVNGITVGRGGGNESTNTAIGFDALSVNAPDGDNDLGIKNTAIGYDALKSNTTGTGNTAIGYGADVFSSGLTNATAIGSGAKVYGDNTIVLGNAAVTEVQTTGSVYAAAYTAIELLNGQINDMASFGVNGLVTSGTLTAGDVSYTNIKGNDGDFLKIDGSGNSSWAPIPSPDLSNYATTNTAQTITEAKTFSKDLTVNGITVGRGGLNVISNTAIGGSALSLNTTGSFNTANGYRTLSANTTGYNNTATGADALTSNTTGYYNTAYGSSTLLLNTTGVGNTAIGTSALLSNSTGNGNTAIGYGADVASDILTNSTAIGYGAIVSASDMIQLGNTDVDNVKTSGTLTAGTVTYPRAHGTAGQVLSTTGSGTLGWTSIASPDLTSYVTTNTAQTITEEKTFSKDLAVNGITVGRGGNNQSGNTAVGISALLNNSGGDGNTASGERALSSNTDGNENTANGWRALYLNTTGNKNTVSGNSALLFNADGNSNTAIGYRAGRKIADDSGNNTTSDFSVYLGSETKASSDGAQNEIVIGYNAIGAGTNTIQLGNTDVTNVKTSGTLTAGTVTYPNVHNSTSGQVLTIDGAGTATWAVSTSITEVSDEFTATGGETTFTISHAKGTNRTIKMYINGIRVSNTAYSDSLTTVTYTSANNGGYTIVAGDRIQFDFSY